VEVTISHSSNNEWCWSCQLFEKWTPQPQKWYFGTSFYYYS